eukprot:7353288-Pyramimonas_sp.AAC.1
MDDSQLGHFFGVREYSGGELNCLVVERGVKRERISSVALESVPPDQSDAGSASIILRLTNQTQEARVYSYA